MERDSFVRVPIRYLERCNEIAKRYDITPMDALYWCLKAGIDTVSRRYETIDKGEIYGTERRDSNAEKLSDGGAV